MRLNEIVSKPIQGSWTHHHVPGCTCNTMNEALQTFQPGVSLNLRDHEILTEATYKELASMIDPNFLSQGIRTSELRRVEFYGFDGNTMQFLVPSKDFDENSTKYLCSVQFDDWDAVGSDSSYKNAREKALMLLWAGNVKLNCTDPSFLYWGYQYLLSVMGSAINQEVRKPVIRNPQERGIVCKHLNKVLRVLPFHNAQIASEIKRQFGG